MKSIEYSLVIPVFNEGRNLEILQRKIDKVMKEIRSSFEVIYVDDNSEDDSIEVLQKLKENFPEMRIFLLDRHRGQSCALVAGFKVAKGQWVITMDADLQNDPEDIKKMVPYKEEFDFITGIRKKRKDSLIRILSSRIACFFRRVVLGDITKDVGCSLRLFRREIVDFIPFFHNFHRFFTYLVRKLGYRVIEIPVSHYPRKFGNSKYGIRNRLFQGIFDLWGVFWLKKRLLRYQRRELSSFLSSKNNN